MPMGINVLRLFALGHALIARVSEHIALFSVYQRAGLRENRELRKANEILKLASAFLMKLRLRLFSPRRSSTAD